LQRHSDDDNAVTVKEDRLGQIAGNFVLNASTRRKEWWSPQR
jgi:hypothetical protein